MKPLPGRVRALLWLAAIAGAVLVAVLGDPRWLVAPAIGYAVWRVGTAMLGGLVTESKEPSGPPQPIADPDERVLYRCETCGAELLLVVRGDDTPPRHCGERMRERVEVPRN